MILVTGGAGYIGSHMVALLSNSLEQVLVLDNLSTGHRQAVVDGVRLVVGDLADRDFLARLFSQFDITAVIHFAAFSQVGESNIEPAKYYCNNVVNTQNLLDAMIAAGVKQLIFSSTAAVYGLPLKAKIDESHPLVPINPYGRTKLAIEWMLEDYANAYGLQAVSLRYFNAAGADPNGILGERHEPETHLIPLVLQVASGRRTHIKVFGRDYHTPDGTCLRDYIHVVDLCRAHAQALQWLQNTISTGKGLYEVFNLGNGVGFSVLQVIETVHNITGRSVPIVAEQRRPGDAAVLVADIDKARQRLGWQGQYIHLEQMITHAWAWEQTMCQLQAT